ncbi:MAG: MBL fold metallo-hydrolase [Deltaproteobacteria bacterium]|nr:MBL fold metallo-hydrolase [Deltaproteobacteria bacterium]
MLTVKQFGKITRFKMGREIQGVVPYWCAAWLVEGLLVDAGCPATAGELAETLAGRQLDTVVNTHHHEDHSGGNAELARRLGVRLLASAAAGEEIRRGFYMQPYRQLVWGEFEPSETAPLGDTLRAGPHTFQVLPAPGHAEDHVVLVEPDEGWAFVGDLYVARRPKTARPEDDSIVTRLSLEKLRALGPRTLFTGLGEVVTEAIAALDECITHLAEMEAQVKALTAQGLTPPEIVIKIFGRESNLAPMTEGHYSYENFVRSFLK